METWEWIFSIVVIAIGVAAIAYILLRTPKTAAHIGSEGEISLGEAEPAPEAEETVTEATEEPATEETEATEE